MADDGAADVLPDAERSGGKRPPRLPTWGPLHSFFRCNSLRFFISNEGACRDTNASQQHVGRLRVLSDDRVAHMRQVLRLSDESIDSYERKERCSNRGPRPSHGNTGRLTSRRNILTATLPITASHPCHPHGRHKVSSRSRISLILS